MTGAIAALAGAFTTAGSSSGGSSEGGGGGGTLVATLSPNSQGVSNSSATVASESCTAILTGGVGPFTYAWVKDSGGFITATNPASAATSFQALGMERDESRSAQFRCNVTDTGNGNAVTQSDLASVTLERL